MQIQLIKENDRMDLKTIKEIAQAQQRDANWKVATILKFKNGEFAAYYSESQNKWLERDAYIVLDVLERGSIPIKEIAIYYKDTECLDYISAYLRKALIAINRENYDAEILMKCLDNTLHSRKIGDI